MTNILEDTERRAVYLGRLASGLLKAKIVPTLDAAYKAARLILLDAGDNVSITKRNQVTAAIRRAIAEIDNDGWSDVTKELENIAIYDAGYYAGLVGSAVSIKLNTPADEKITSYINKSIMSLTDRNRTEAGLWSQFVRSKVLHDVDRIDSIIVNGFGKGATTKEILRELELLTKGELTKQAEALVRTGVIHYSNQAREAMFIDNDVDDVVFVATLDNRTTLTCSSKDGKRYKIDDPAKPVPPLHFNCRSTMIPAIAMQDVDTRAAVGGQKGPEAADEFERLQDKTDKKVKYRGRKDSDIFKAGQIKYTQYDEWLKKQPAWFQDSALGKGKAEIFRQGKLSLAQFVDLAGRPLTLAELQALDGNT